MNIIIELFFLVKHENTSKKGQIKKIMSHFSENIGTNWTGFICQQTGLIRQRTGLICRRLKLVHRRIKPVRQRIKPVHLVLIFFFFSQLFAFCQQRELYNQNQHTKLLILKSYVDLLNYPFKSYPWQCGIISSIDLLIKF